MTCKTRKYSTWIRSRICGENIMSIEKLQESNAWRERLAKVLENPINWTYDGQSIDYGKTGGKCSCEHPIRYGFILNHKDGEKTAIVGSTCIDHYGECAEHIISAINNEIKNLQAKERQAKAKQKELQQNEEIKKLLEELNEKINQFGEIYKNADYWIRYDYRLCVVTRKKTYKNLTTYIKALKNDIDHVQERTKALLIYNKGLDKIIKNEGYPEFMVQVRRDWSNGLNGQYTYSIKETGRVFFKGHLYETKRKAMESLLR